MNESFADHLDSLDSLLNVNEVCALLGLHHDTLYRWVRAKEIPVIRIGTAAKPLLRFSPKELATWVREAPYFVHGPSRFIADWMEIQVLHRGGPRCRPPLLAKVLALIKNVAVSAHGARRYLCWPQRLVFWPQLFPATTP